MNISTNKSILWQALTIRLNYAPDWIIPMPLTIQTQGFQGNALLEGNLNPLPLTRRAPIQGSSFLAKSDLSDCKCHDCKMTTTEAKNREKIRLATHNDPSKTPSYPPGMISGHAEVKRNRLFDYLTFHLIPDLLSRLYEAAHKMER